jgi:Pectic acid lyase
MGCISKKAVVSLLVFTVLRVASTVSAQEKQGARFINWHEALKQRSAWYGGPEAMRVADNVVLYQRDSGGWPKNVDMAILIVPHHRTAIVRQRNKNDSTIDNGATFSQLIFLARVYSVQRLEHHRASFLKGLDYLLKAQYPNGGWPQFYPDLSGYFKRITFNDGAMIGVMKLLRDVAAAKSDYEFVDKDRRLNAADRWRATHCLVRAIR